MCPNWKGKIFRGARTESRAIADGGPCPARFIVSCDVKLGMHRGQSRRRQIERSSTLETGSQVRVGSSQRSSSGGRKKNKRAKSGRHRIWVGKQLKSGLPPRSECPLVVPFVDKKVSRKVSRKTKGLATQKPQALLFQLLNFSRGSEIKTRRSYSSPAFSQGTRHGSYEQISAAWKYSRISRSAASAPSEAWTRFIWRLLL